MSSEEMNNNEKRNERIREIFLKRIKEELLKMGYKESAYIRHTQLTKDELVYVDFDISLGNALPHAYKWAIVKHSSLPTIESNDVAIPTKVQEIFNIGEPDSWNPCEPIKKDPGITGYVSSAEHKWLESERMIPMRDANFAAMQIDNRYNELSRVLLEHIEFVESLRHPPKVEET